MKQAGGKPRRFMDQRQENMSRETTANTIASRVCAAELKACRALGYSEVESYFKSFAVLEETYGRAMDVDRPAVWPRLTTVTGVA